MRVEIIEAETKYELEKKINNKLRKHTSDEILDLKYSGLGSYSSLNNTCYSVMIIYK